MQVGVMVTNGGPHPPEKWAVTTAEQIFPISQDMEGSRFVQAKEVQLAIVKALLPHHGGVMSREQGKLAESHDRLDEAYDPEHRVDAALAEVIACVKGSPWEAKTEDPAWRHEVGNVICSHFATVMDVERQWHAHKNKSAKGDAFLASKNGV